MMVMIVKEVVVKVVVMEELIVMVIEMVVK
jgi:hypothetical protein